MAPRPDRHAAIGRAIPRGAPEWPAGLLDLADPPDLLHVRGTIPRVPLVAIVGARAATPYGLAVAERLAHDLVRLGKGVVSGLAHGIDAAAHRGALEAGGATVAMLPCGHDCITPRGHEELAARIAASGAVVTEYPDGTSARKWMFLARNRLIAACADAVVVVEARERSGALATAAHARGLARPLLAVPGDVDRPSSRGCHALIRAGARLCEGPADVLTALEARGATSSAGAEDSPAMRLLAALDAPVTLEACARACGLTIGEAQARLLELEWSGLARSAPGARWVRVRNGG